MDIGDMGNSWEGMADGGKIMEEGRETGELESQYKRGFPTVERNTHNSGLLKNMHLLAK